MAFDKAHRSMVTPPRHFADVTAVAGATMGADEDGQLITVGSLGIYRLLYGNADTANGASVLTVGNGRAHRMAIGGGGGIATVATIAALLALNSPADRATAIVDGFALYRFDASYSGPLNDETAIAKAPGAWIMQIPSMDAMFAYLEPEFEALQDQIDDAKALTASFDWNPPSVAANSSQSINVVVPGAAVGDFTQIAPLTAVDARLVLSCFVTDANTVAVRFGNPSAGAIDPPLTTLRVVVMKS